MSLDEVRIREIVREIVKAEMDAYVLAQDVYGKREMTGLPTKPTSDLERAADVVRGLFSKHEAHGDFSKGHIVGWNGAIGDAIDAIRALPPSPPAEPSWVLAAHNKREVAKWRGIAERLATAVQYQPNATEAVRKALIETCDAIRDAAVIESQSPPTQGGTPHAR